MSYSYDTLEEVLELAAYRLPVKTLGLLIARAEHVIAMNEDGYELERDIQKMLGTLNIFTLKKLGAAQHSPVSAAA